MVRAIDYAAKEHAFRRIGMPECLHVPVAAVDESAIRTYIGEIVQPLGRGMPRGALLVHIDEPPLRDDRLPIWDREESRIFYQRQQVWVRIEYTRYRQAYRKAFPLEDLTDKILSHCMNRRAAALKGFHYVRIVPVTRSANSSSAFSEGWGVAGYRKATELAAFKQRGLAIQYADLPDLMLMLDMKVGGGIMSAVNAAQKLIRARE